MNCITYVGHPNTNGDGPYDSRIQQGQTKEHNKEEVAEIVNAELREITNEDYDFTLIFTGLEMGEGGDRPDYNWI